MNKMLRIMEAIENNFLIRVVRRGMLLIMPIVLIASVAQAIISFPVAAFREWMSSVLGGGPYYILSCVRDFSFSNFSVIISISTAVSYAIERKGRIESVLLAPVLSGTVFVLLMRADLGSMDVKMGVEGCVFAIVSALAVSAIYIRLMNSPVSRLCRNTGTGDIIYSGVMSSIVPCIIIMVSAAFISYIFYDILGIDNIIEWMGIKMERFMRNFHNEFLIMLVSIASIQSLWFLGTHGSNVFDNFMQLHSGVGSDIVFSKTFVDVFVNMGGCGTTICVIAAILIFSKYKKTKSIVRTAIFPVIFNINEILTFGIPIIWNPTMLIPFILVPIECGIIAYAAIKMGIVSPVINNVEWTVPIIASGYIATNGSFSGAALQLFNILVGTLTYMPFIKINEHLQMLKIKEQVKQITEELRRAELNGTDADLISRTDVKGSIVRMLMDDLREAVKKKETYLLYQPQFMANGTCIGAEALIRWRHPVAGMIYPPLIIYLAREGGFLPEIETQIFDNACRAISITDKASTRKFKISVNITAKSFAWDGLEDCISSAVDRYGIKPEKLWIEITEQDILSRDTSVIDKITKLKGKGHSFLIDDFGMGRTSLLYLQTNLFDGVKLDGSLIHSMLTNNTNREIVASVIKLSERLGIKAIAEYVETEEHCIMLDAMGCDWYQGYYFSRPVPLERFIECIGKKCSVMPAHEERKPVNKVEDDSRE